MTSVEPDDLEVEEGIDILYSGPKDPIADVVFVHGLTGRGTTSWQKGDVLWPKELLPKQLPNVRIIAWNYNVDVLRFFNSKSKEKSILQHAENLLFDLGGEREEEGRPIIFIGHSLGGLVIKQALVIASQSEHSQDDNTAGYVDIINSTIGIVFLGVSHRSYFADHNLISCLDTSQRQRSSKMGQHRNAISSNDGGRSQRHHH